MNCVVASASFQSADSQSTSTLRVSLWRAQVFLTLVALVGLALPTAQAGDRVNAGGLYSCGIRADSSVVCWGDNIYGQASPPTGSFVKLSAGWYHACGLRPDHTVTCWGRNDVGQATPPTETFIEVRAGPYYTCGLRNNGSLVCWGDNSYGQASPPAGSFTQISTGWYHACAIRIDGTLSCWGDNSKGQSDPPAGTFTQSSAGAWHSCGLQVDGSVQCWGDNSYAQASPPTGNFVELDAGGGGGFHSCALRVDGTLDCWGGNFYGQASPTSGAFLEVSAGGFHSCGLLLNGSAHCWGYNDTGQANPPGGSFATPAPLKSISAGDSHTCAIRSDDTIACWGYDFEGQASPPLGSFTQISAGAVHTCGLRPDRSIECWGSSGYIQAPTGTFVQTSAGYLSSCGIRTDGSLACWGQLGGFEPTGTFTQISVWYGMGCGVRTDASLACWGYNFETPPAGSFVQVDVNVSHTGCAVRTDGTLVCWGTNAYGEGSPPTGSFIEVGVGDYHSCGLRTDGALACWGYRSDQDFGQYTPPAGRFVELAVGDFHNCALRTDGVTVCWGHDAAGAAPQVVLMPETLPDGVLASSYSQSLSLIDHVLTGGEQGQTSPYVPVSPAFALTAGSLPSGLSLSATGLISGTTPATDGMFNFTVEGEDANGFVAQRAYALIIGSGGVGGDSTPPMIAAHADVGPVEATSASGAVVSYVTPATSDAADGPSAATCLPASGSAFALGSSVVTCQAVDTAGNQAAQTQFSVSVVDTTPPVIAAHADADPVDATGASGAVVSYLSPTTTDQVDGAGTAACSPTSGSTFPSGSSAVTCTAADAAGNLAAPTSFNVTVTDTTPPVIVPSLSGSQGNNGWYVGPVTVSWSFSDAESTITSTTGCGTVMLGADSPGVSFTCTAVSAGGSASEMVTVKLDATPPALNPVFSTRLLLNASATALAGATDALSGLAEQGCASLNTASIGTRNVVCTAKDSAGNSASASVAYSVVYGFVGFQSPVANPEVLNTLSVKRVIPLKWRVVDAQGAPVINLAIATIEAQTLGGPVGVSQALTSFGSGSTKLKNLGNGYYQLDWKAPASYRNTSKVLILNMGDFANHRAYFRFD